MSVEINAGIRAEYRSDTNFDSRLDLGSVAGIRNADLVIDVRVHFHRRDAGRVQDGAGVNHTTLNWSSDSQFRDWVARCKALLESRLSGRIWLVPDADWGVKVTFPGGHYRPNVKCLLRVIPVEAGQRKHLWIDCHRVNPNYCPRSTAATSTAPVFTSNMGGQNLGFARNFGQVVNVDIWSCAMPSTEAHFQEVAVHEFYHFLGFEHVAFGTAACPATSGGNGTACYGGTPYQRGSLGGMGGRVEEWMHRPWTRALARHLAWSVQWAATMTRRPPTRVVVPGGSSVAARPPETRRVPVGMDGGV